MRLVGRILVVLGFASAPTVVAVIGCNVDVASLPPLPNELPNIPGTPVSGSASTSSSSSSSTSSSSSSGSTDGGVTNPATTECDCAEAELNGSSSCLSCQSIKCLTQYDNCQAGDCPAATACANGCGNTNQGPCLANCINSYPDYAALIGCLFLDGCASSCGVAAPLSNCPISDAGPG